MTFDKTHAGCWEEMAETLFPTHVPARAQFVERIAKALKEAVEAEQDRCAKIAEYVWEKKDPMTADFTTTGAAYWISTNIRALRRPLYVSSDAGKTK
jgi:hypothetical protein